MKIEFEHEFVVSVTILKTSVKNRKSKRSYLVLTFFKPSVSCWQIIKVRNKEFKKSMESFQGDFALLQEAHELIPSLSSVQFRLLSLLSKVHSSHQKNWSSIFRIGMLFKYFRNFFERLCETLFVWCYKRKLQTSRDLMRQKQSIYALIYAEKHWSCAEIALISFRCFNIKYMRVSSFFGSSFLSLASNLL